MTFQKYPLARYRNGEYIAVANEAEEAARAAEGFTDWHTDQERSARHGAANTLLAEALAVSVAPIEAIGEQPIAPPAAEKRKPGRPRKA